MHYFYAPNTVNVPLHTQKGQFNATAAINIAQDHSATELQSSYAFSPNLAAMGNLYLLNKNSSASASLLELGFGTFKKLNKKIVAELYTGAALATVNNYYGTDKSSQYSKLKGNRFFIQPNIGFKSRFFDAAFSLRFCNMLYSTFATDSVPLGMETESLNYLRSHPSQWIMEPAFTLRGGFENAKLQLQVLGRRPFHDEFRVSSNCISLGLIWQFPSKLEKK